MITAHVSPLTHKTPCLRFNINPLSFFYSTHTTYFKNQFLSSRRIHLYSLKWNAHPNTKKLLNITELKLVIVFLLEDLEASIGFTLKLEKSGFMLMNAKWVVGHHFYIIDDLCCVSKFDSTTT
ncbi:hypothetical protein HanRHA438_Chr14g0682771 [Helianthus annuus]|nr:hypothetical protein HanHA89_Chr14g0595091 [Helianthus annuus]KAJ0658338.1 hypothetical protein HanLR1_Chr14g0556601 [Helianthus annuus]KAJ0661998.1 hypothetical protein HanOQP8_Chr14g0554621 [Helianthus annuus]KAJ0856299.1 hypothetical protein HanRHA438_Chr14g0682771 [Helianthus annuus]